MIIDESSICLVGVDARIVKVPFESELVDYEIVDSPIPSCASVAQSVQRVVGEPKNLDASLVEIFGSHKEDAEALVRMQSVSLAGSSAWYVERFHVLLSGT